MCVYVNRCARLEPVIGMRGLKYMMNVLTLLCLVFQVNAKLPTVTSSPEAEMPS